MSQKFQFLCGNFENEKVIYATKFGKHPWYFFDKKHRIITQHESIPAKFEKIKADFKKVRSIEVLLNNDETKRYYQNGKFVFKNVELKTHINLGNKSPVNREIKRHSEETKNIVFMSGETNPVDFLTQFEKCVDMKSDRDKLWRIRHFVQDQHKAEFSQLRFTGDWVTAKGTFLEKYCVPFIENKKKEINIEFSKEPDLRSFVNQKLSGLSSYTSLTFINQMEIILNELPDEVAYIFMVNEIFNCTKDEVLDFCDSVQDMVDMYNKECTVQKLQNQSIQIVEPNCGSDDFSDSACSSLTLQQNSLTPGKRVSGNSVRPRKRKLTSIPEDESCVETMDFNFLNEMSSSSKSTWSSCSESSNRSSNRSSVNP